MWRLEDIWNRHLVQAMRWKQARAPLVSTIANNVRISGAINVRNPLGTADLARRAYSRKFRWTTLVRDFSSFSPHRICNCGRK